MKKWMIAVMALVLTLMLGMSAQAQTPVDVRLRTLNRLEQIAKTVYPSSLKMTPARATITNLRGKPGTIQLKASTTPSLGALTDPTITWISGNIAVATVSADGLVTGVAPGTVKIYASIQGKNKPLKVACALKVRETPVASIRLSEADLVLLDHTKTSEKTHKLAATIAPANATRQEIFWSTSDPAVATVDENGVVTAIGAGTAKITATVAGTKNASVEVRVRSTAGMVSIKISAGGDIVLGGDAIKRTDKRFEQMISQSGSPDYGYVLKNLAPVFSRDDITILNLEGPLKGGFPLQADRTYNFYGKPEYVNILKEGSVEVLNVVNNHINDYGTKSATKSILRQNGLALSDTAYNATSGTMTVNGVKVGFIGFQTPTSIVTIRNKARELKKACDVAIVSIHFCHVPEHTQQVLDSQIAQAHAAVQGGADLVLGHHPHVVSGMERYMSKYIYYDLGSVESSGPRFKYNFMIMQQELLVDLANGYVEPQTPTVYAGNASSAPKNQPNNCQPMLYGPSDAGYAKTFADIDKYSRRSGLNPAPYNKGTP